MNELFLNKKMLDDMQKKKDMSDDIYVINVGGQTGDITTSKIKYANAQEKEVRYISVKLLKGIIADYALKCRKDISLCKI
ncbi:hypothetical protein [Oribacterium sp. KHPX15]|uniref:hypothetical protein n=1 Tax=Oribacterium sp. KHPX15 TaxID=1855342 RepID=UPI000B87AD73|nr:hypothetical protein [Oribacterium sp. KHPX15]